MFFLSGRYIDVPFCVKYRESIVAIPVKEYLPPSVKLVNIQNRIACPNETPLVGR